MCQHSGERASSEGIEIALRVCREEKVKTINKKHEGREKLGFITGK